MTVDAESEHSESSLVKARMVAENVHLGSSATIWLAVLAILVAARIVSPHFWAVGHLLNVLRQASPLGILAIGQAVVLITGGIDLSNGQVVTLVNVVSAAVLGGDDALLGPVLLLCLGLGALVGLVNGLIVSKLRVPSLIVTFGMASILRGISYVYTGGSPRGSIPPSLRFVGSGFVGPVPTAIFFWIAVALIGPVLLRKTPFGRHLYARGGNERAARLSGVRTDLTTVAAYVFSSILAVVAGLIISGYIGTGSLGAGNGRDLDSLAAAVVGGTQLTGGVGTVIGTCGGALFLALLFSLVRFVGLPYSSQLMIHGLILVIAAYAHVRSGRS